MQVISINTGQAGTLDINSKSVRTGIFKQARSGPVLIERAGVEGDTIVDRLVHGGEDQAVYLYSQADYAWWSQSEGKAFAAGSFGENLTISDFHSGLLRIGDRLKINELELEITAPRVPCVKFASKMGDPTFGKKFVAAQRPGAYARVLSPGMVQAGDKLEWCPTTDDFASIVEVFIEWHQKAWSPHIANKALRSPISKIARRLIEERTGLS